MHSVHCAETTTRVLDCSIYCCIVSFSPLFPLKTQSFFRNADQALDCVFALFGMIVSCGLENMI